jgi:hypothetical protein
MRYRLFHQDEDKQRANTLAQWLKEHQSKGYGGACWGYPFDWPNRAFYAPAGTPTIVNTAFIGHSLLDLFEETGQEEWLQLAVSASQFLCQDLHRTAGKRGFCFSYTPLDQSQVHNANLLGASLLARAGKISCSHDYIKDALNSAYFSIAAQRPNGSWSYGEASSQSWIDSFHTGYNLMALKDIFEATEEQAVKDTLDKGYRYYLENFFLPDGTVKYYHDRAEPLDAHAFAHAVFCLSELDDHINTPSGFAQKVIKRMIELFWSGEGYFYWQRYNGFLYRMPCMRWVQSWAFLALITFLKNTEKRRQESWKSF